MPLKRKRQPRYSLIVGNGGPHREAHHVAVVPTRHIGRYARRNGLVDTVTVFSHDVEFCEELALLRRFHQRHAGLDPRVFEHFGVRTWLDMGDVHPETIVHVFYHRLMDQPIAVKDGFCTLMATVASDVTFDDSVRRVASCISRYPHWALVSPRLRAPEGKRVFINIANRVIDWNGISPSQAMLLSMEVFDATVHETRGADTVEPLLRAAGEHPLELPSAGISAYLSSASPEALISAMDDAVEALDVFCIDGEVLLPLVDANYGDGSLVSQIVRLSLGEELPFGTNFRGLPVPYGRDG